MIATHQSQIVKKLLELGIIPPRCRKWTLESEAGGVLKVTAEIFVSPEEDIQIADTFAQHPEELRPE